MQQWNLKGNDSNLITLTRNAFSNDSLEYIENILSEHSLQEAEVRTSKGNAVDNSVRSTKVSFFDYTDKRLENFYRSIVDIVTHTNDFNYYFRLTHIENLQYSLYDSSTQDRYDYHLDSPGVYSLKNTLSCRKLSFSLLLDTQGVDYTGGNFMYMTSSKENKVEYNRGDIVFFPSYILHKVEPVTSGTRRSIVGWVHGPHWV